MVFIDTNRFKQTAPQYGRSLVLTLPAATSDTVELSAWSERALRKIYRKGYGFKKAGVMLMDLSPAAERQSMLFDDTEHMARRVRLNAALDAVNARYGRGTLAVAGAGLRSGSHQQAPRWGMRRDLLTPAYTTRWDELPVVR
jgi:DNA polymerase V